MSGHLLISKKQMYIQLTVLTGCIAPDISTVVFRVCCCISSILQPQTKLHRLLQRLGCQGLTWTISSCKLDLSHLVTPLSPYPCLTLVHAQPGLAKRVSRTILCSWLAPYSLHSCTLLTQAVCSNQALADVACGSEQVRIT